MNNIVSVLGNINRSYPNIKTVWYTDTEIFAEYRDGIVCKTHIQEFNTALNEIERKRELNENT
jgi:hypothetical protein